MVEVIILMLRHKEDMLVGLGASLVKRSHAHLFCVNLVPDYLLAEIPAILLQGEGYAPRDAHKVFDLDTVWSPALEGIWLDGGFYSPSHSLQCAAPRGPPR